MNNKVGFQNPLHVGFLKKKNGVKWYYLKQDLIYHRKVPTGVRVIVVERDFITDLASVPRGLKWLFKPNGKYSRASVLHDYLYSTKEFTRKECDKIFLEAMKSDKVNFFTRRLFWLAVRLGGRKYYY